MFPITHIYCTKEITKNNNSFLLYGSILPDIPATGLVGWEDIKNNTQALSDYILKKYPKL